MVENLLEKNMTENFSNLEKEADIHVHEAQRIPNKMNPKRYTLRYYSQKLKERTLKASRYKWLLYKRETPRILSTLFHGNGIG